jgi:hypothetical protein
MKEKLEHISKIGKNIPRALFEGSLITFTGLGGVAATIGAGTAYLLGYPEIAKIVGLGGFCAGIGGVAGIGLYGILNSHGGEFGCLEEGDYAIDNIINEIRRYKQEKKK